jgi:hypothetical protein
MTAFADRAKTILQREFGHALRPELDAALTGLMEAEEACGFNEYDAAIATVVAILGLCGTERINLPVARRAMVEMSRRVAGVAHLGRRDGRAVRARLIALARMRGADAALMEELAAILADSAHGAALAGPSALALH